MLLRKHFKYLGILWRRRVEDYELFLADVLGDYLFERSFDSVEEVDKRIIKKIPTQEPTPEEFVIKNEEKERVQEVLKTLGPKEEKVIKLRFGIGEVGEYTLREIGRELGVTHERVRQIESKALRKLRHPARSKLLIPFIRK